MAAPVLQFKRGLLTNLPGLRAGEPGFTTDSYDLYVGLTSETSTNKFFGSHRYWIKETTSTGSAVNLVEGTSNGSDYISIKSPDTLSGVTTYTLPETPVDTYLLTTNGSGVLSWTNAVPGGTITGISTFTDTTDNTLGNADTGAVQIDGGLGVNKNLTVGANLNVQGYSEFVGVVTFKGGTINLGDENTDDINVAGEFISNLVPNSNDTYDIGIGGKGWRNANFTGVGTFATGAVIDNLQIGISGTNEIDTSSGNLTLDSAGGQVIIDDNLSVVGVSTFGSDLDINASIDVDGHTELDNLNVSGVSTFASAVDINSDLDVDGHTELDNLNVSGVSTFASAVDINSDLDVDGHTELDNLNVSGVSTFIGAIDVDGGANISGGETILSSATVSDLTSGRVVLAGTSGSLEDSLNLTFGAGGLIVGANGINVTGFSTFSTDVTVGGDLTVGGNDIKASDGTTALTLADSTGAVTAASDLTVSGNLYVSGNTTQVNTAALTVEDRTIDLGIVNGATPASATTWDLGVLFNYYTGGAAKKSAVVWEHGDTRFKFASVLGADTNGTDNNTPQLTVTTFAPIEIGALWVTDCAGTSQVISCTGTERFLENITVDAGQF